ncbi:MAG: hypothetical protein ACK559_31850, partial [bacterium]
HRLQRRHDGVDGHLPVGVGRTGLEQRDERALEVEDAVARRVVAVLRADRRDHQIDVDQPGRGGVRVDALVHDEVLGVPGGDRVGRSQLMRQLVEQHREHRSRLHLDGRGVDEPGLRIERRVQAELGG